MFIYYNYTKLKIFLTQISFNVPFMLHPPVNMERGRIRCKPCMSHAHLY